MSLFKMVVGGAVGMVAFASFMTVAVASTNGFMASKEKMLSELRSNNSAVKTEMGEKPSHLPGTSEVLTEEKSIFQSLSLEVDTVKQRLAQAEEEGALAIKSAKKQYEEDLKAQHLQNSAIQRENEDIGQEVADLYDTISGIRASASDLRQLNAGLTTRLEIMRENLTIAQEFAEIAMNASGSMLSFNVPELQVLQELDQKDAAAFEARTHENRLKEVTINHKLSFLQTDIEISGHRHPLDSRVGSKNVVMSAKEMLSVIVPVLEDLADAQSASDALLRGAFDEEFQKGEERRQVLLQTQAELRKTRDSALQLKARLIEAKNELAEKHTKLTNDIKTIQQFTKQLGNNESPTRTSKNNKVVALLQVSQEKKNQIQATTPLPDFSQITRKSKEALAAVSSRFNSLETYLAEVQNEDTATIQADKKEYETKLEAQRNENFALEKTCAALTKRIQDLKDWNTQLRLKAESLRHLGASLTSDLNSLRTNLSVAQEFADTALTDSEDMLTNAEPLKVLVELAKRDVAAGQVQAHELRLNEIRNANKISMLQTGTGVQDNDNALDLLQSFASVLDDLAQEENTSRTSLKEAFEKEFHAGEQRHQELLAEQAELNTTMAVIKNLQEKLTAAVLHLEDANKKLRGKSIALRRFSRGLADRSLPTSLLQVSQEQKELTHVSMVSHMMSKSSAAFTALSSKDSSLGTLLTVYD